MHRLEHEHLEMGVVYAYALIRQIKEREWTLNLNFDLTPLPWHF